MAKPKNDRMMSDIYKLYGIKYVPVEKYKTIERQRDMLLEALKEIRSMLSESGEYSICRTDGKPMPIHEVVMCGSIFEKAEQAIAKVEGEKDG